MATYDPVSVANMALDRIGIGQPIDALEENSDEARACNRWYEKCRDKVLGLGIWPFAKRQVALGLVEEDPNDAWGFSYRYPINCIRVLNVVTGMRLDVARIEWAMGQDDTGRLIYTDEEDALVEYVGTFDDPGEWFDLFADTVAWLLASEIAGPLRTDPGIAARCLNGFMESKASAMAKAQAEGYLRRATSSYITTRGGTADARDFPARS